MVTPSNIFTAILAAVERIGVNCDVTLHTLDLGIADSTGQYIEGYTDSTIKMVINVEQGLKLENFGIGKYSNLSAKGFSSTLVTDGCKVTDAFNNVWRVTAVSPYMVGDVLAYYTSNLALTLTGEGSSATPPPTPVLPPTYSGLLSLNLGYFASPAIREVGNVYGENASEAIHEHGYVYGATKTNSISEVGTSEALTPTQSYVGATNFTANNSLGDNWTLPGGWAAGDLAVFWWYTFSGSKTIVKPATVTQLQDASNASYGHMFIGYRMLQAGDTTFAWTSSSVANSDVIWGTSVFHDTNAAPIGNEYTPTTFSASGATGLFPLTIGTNMSGMIMIYGKRNDYTSITAPVGTTLCGSGSSTAGSDASAGAAYILALKNTPYVFPSFTLGGGGTDEGYVYALEIKT